MTSTNSARAPLAHHWPRARRAAPLVALSLACLAVLTPTVAPALEASTRAGLGLADAAAARAGGLIAGAARRVHATARERLRRAGGPVVSTAPHESEMLPTGACIADCFDGTYAHTTPAYVALGAARAVTLLYRSSSVDPHRLVQLDVGDTTGLAATTRLAMSDPSGQYYAVFANGSNYAYVATAPNATSRVAARVNVGVGGCVARAVPYRAYVQLLDAQGQATHSPEALAPLRVLHVDETCSRVGVGWTIAGTSRLRGVGGGGAADSVVLWDADGSVVFHGGGSVDGGGVRYYDVPAGTAYRLTLEPAAGVDSARYYRRSLNGGVAAYDAGGYLVWSSDRSGNATRYRYGSAGAQRRLERVIDPMGDTTVFGYDPNDGLLKTITDPMGRVTRLTHDSQGRVQNIMNPDSSWAATGMTYDSSHRLTGWADRAGGAWSYEYDAAGKLGVARAPLIPTTVGLVRPATQLAAADAAVAPVVSSGATAPRVIPESVHVAVADAEGHASSTWLDRRGQPLRVVDALGDTTTITRDAGGRPLKVVSPASTADSTVYDTNGMPTKVMSAAGDTTFIAYNATFADRPDSVWGPRQPMRRFRYTAAGLPDTVRVISGPTTLLTTYLYDSRGRDTMVTSADGAVSRFRYDTVFGNRRVTDGPGTYVATTLFDRYGRDSVTTEEAVLDVGLEPVATATYTYDALNRPLLTTGPDGSRAYTYSTTTAPDSTHVTRVTLADGRTHRYAFNALGWTTSERVDTAPAQMFAYDRDGNLRTYTNRRGQAVTATYDVLHRSLTKGGANVDSVTWSWAANGLSARAATTLVVDSAYADAVGRDTAAVTCFAPFSPARCVRRSARYGNGGVPDSLVFGGNTGVPLQSRGWTWNATTGRLASLRFGAHVATVGYGGLGVWDSTTFSGGTKKIDEHGESRRPHQNRSSRPSLDPAVQRKYGYDDLGRLANAFFDSAGSDYKRTWTYDGGRLVGEWDETSTSTCVSRHTRSGYTCSGTASRGHRTFDHDALGNRTATQTFNNQGTLVGTVTASYAAARLTGDGTHSYEYDADGNLAKRTAAANPADSTRYVWSADGLLREVRTYVPSSSTVAWDYDAAGQPVRRRLNGTAERHLVWQGGQLVAELDAAAATRIGEYAYYPGVDRPMAYAADTGATPAVRWLYQDAVGNVIAAAKQDSVVSYKATYSPWGAPTLSGADTATAGRLLWKGLAWDAGTGLYYMRARWYDPQAGRFVSEDPIGLAGGGNVYSFGGGDPINNADPSGLWPWPRRLPTVRVIGERDPGECDFFSCFVDGMWASAPSSLGVLFDDPAGSARQRAISYRALTTCSSILQHPDTRQGLFREFAAATRGGRERGGYLLASRGTVQVLFYGRAQTPGGIALPRNAGASAYWHTHQNVAFYPAGQGPSDVDQNFAAARGAPLLAVSRDSLFVVYPHGGAEGCAR